MQLTKEITKVIDNFLHEKGIYGVDRDDLEHKIAERSLCKNIHAEL